MKRDIGSDFIRLTQYQFMEGESDQEKGLPQPSLQLPLAPQKQVINLPDPAQTKLQGINLRCAIERRQSIRRFSQLPMSLDELSWLLWVTQGVRKAYPDATLRNTPSAGARHAFETYISINRVTGLQPGLYRFLALSHQIQAINLEKSVGESLYNICLRQKMVVRSAVNFIWTAVVYRMTWRYRERGYRYLFMDAGHICQNLYLAVQDIGCGNCAIGAFDDKRLNELLGLDGENMFALYMASVGKL